MIYWRPPLTFIVAMIAARYQVDEGDICGGGQRGQAIADARAAVAYIAMARGWSGREIARHCNLSNASSPWIMANRLQRNRLEAFGAARALGRVIDGYGSFAERAELTAIRAAKPPMPDTHHSAMNIEARIRRVRERFG